MTNNNIKKIRKIKKYITKWNIREEDNPKVILTDDLEFYIVELDKVEEGKENSSLSRWLNFIKKPMEVSEMEEEGIKNVAKNMKEEHINIETISKVTGLTKEEIEKL